ncbi:olfactory receptor 7C1-like [Rana temporaria]|uniref:olfactory receptor 7C1-like n=1 Tax=Rana temporaria TaxID=8407 RepID=UPI001AAD2EC9|nr:olfactory receptor 7C1-like [Rana temporaria]
MGNQTFQPEFILFGLSDLTDSQIPVFLLILLIYVATLVGNLLIIFLVASDYHLHTPMYLFLGNLSVLDILIPSVSSSHMFFAICTGNNLISYSSCITQVFFFTWFASTESSILTVMSFDRYVAICHPLRYTTMINIPLCVQIAFFFWVYRFIFILVHTLCVLRLAFPHPATIPGLFCELYQLIQLSSSDTFLNFLLFYLESIILGVTSLLVTFFSYAYIFKTIVKITLKDGRQKAYSTCSSHLTVVFIFYGAGFFNYFQLKTKDFLAGRLISVFYTVITPLLNPIIYSLRNNELKKALRKTLSRISSTP